MSFLGEVNTYLRPLWSLPTPTLQGGFARVYQVRDSRNNYLACKVVTKSSLKTKKAKTKLYAEIKIHQALDHPNVVRFIDCFDDDENAYMTLELCPSGSLMSMLHRRRVFTEPEARFFTMQLIGACHYMHTHQVIHRDLKLGNVLLNADMDIKLGDFGLAALIECPGERRKTICVDIWSIGVILYTFVVGRPPFQTIKAPKRCTNVSATTTMCSPHTETYHSTPASSCNRYSQPARTALVARHRRPRVLCPRHRSWIHTRLRAGHAPPPPDFRHLSPLVSQANASRLRQAYQLDGEVEPATARDIEPPAPSASDASSLTQQEREFQKAVQPGSPISALLSSAHRPLMVAPGGVGAARGEPTLLHKLQAANKDAIKSPAKTHETTSGLQCITAEGGAAYEMQGEEARMKELQCQKVRIVAQMMPARVPRCTESPFEDAENGPAPGLLFRDPSDDVDMPEDRVFIVSWVDYCNKHGMVYAPTDGSVGVHFNASTTLVLAADKQHFDYISPRRQGTVYVRKNYTAADYPEELKNKVYLLKRFEGTSWHSVPKYLRMKHVIVFKLSHDVLQVRATNATIQFNFYDHSKIILSAQGLAIAHIDKNYVLTRWTLS
ncbi:kinase-like domain-containing protein [Lactarius hengduanensis]|nr:kinase-like domain-containing protein [Lactarius hengduanensis]